MRDEMVARTTWNRGQGCCLPTVTTKSSHRSSCKKRCLVGKLACSRKLRSFHRQQSKANLPEVLVNLRYPDRTWRELQGARLVPAPDRMRNEHRLSFPVVPAGEVVYVMTQARTCGLMEAPAARSRDRMSPLASAL